MPKYSYRIKKSWKIPKKKLIIIILILLYLKQEYIIIIIKMKYFSLLLITFITTSCGGNQVANSDGFTYKRTQEDFKKAKIEKQKAGYDLANKGIGPIKNLTFKEIFLNEESWFLGETIIWGADLWSE